MTAGKLAGRSVLVVEDEMMVALMIAEVLEDAGCSVTSVGRLQSAMTEAQSGSFDVAVLDVNLNGERSFAVADLLVARGIPFLFCSGYGEAGLPEEYRGFIVVQKPFRDRDVTQALHRLFAQADAAAPPAWARERPGS